MLGHRVVIPKTCREKVVKELHDSQMGVVKTKSIARNYVWWPGICEAIETKYSAARACASLLALAAPNLDTDTSRLLRPDCWRNIFSCCKFMFKVDW